MASSSSSPSWPIAIVTPEMLKSFHNVDRRLFSRLTMQLGREPAQAMQICALFLWLERTCLDGEIVYKVMQFSLELINMVADEAGIVLNLVESENFALLQEEVLDPAFDIPLMNALVVKMKVSISFFIANRLRVLNGVAQLVAEVCSLVFDDLIRNAAEMRLNYVMSLRRPDGTSSSRGDVMSGLSLDGGNPGAGFILPTFVSPVAPVRQMFVPATTVSRSLLGMAVPGSETTPWVIYQPVRTYETLEEKQRLEDELFESIRQCTMDDVPEENTIAPPPARSNVPPPPPSPPTFRPAPAHKSAPLPPAPTPAQQVVGEVGTVLPAPTPAQQGEGEAGIINPDDRTVFITFSKGYRVQEQELHDFFTNRFGDCIESIHFEMKGKREQPLYAKMVVHNLELLNEIVGSKPPAHFTINSKHVRARKFIPKPNEKS